MNTTSIIQEIRSGAIVMFDVMIENTTHEIDCALQYVRLSRSHWLVQTISPICQ